MFSIFQVKFTMWLKSIWLYSELLSLLLIPQCQNYSSLFSLTRHRYIFLKALIAVLASKMSLVTWVSPGETELQKGNKTSHLLHVPGVSIRRVLLGRLKAYWGQNLFTEWLTRGPNGKPTARTREQLHPSVSILQLLGNRGMWLASWLVAINSPVIQMSQIKCSPSETKFIRRFAQRLQREIQSNKYRSIYLFIGIVRNS